MYYQSADGRASDTKNDMCYEITNVAADYMQCKISVGGIDPPFSLREVQDVVPMPMMQYMAQYVHVSLDHFIPGVADPIELHPVSVTPSITMLVLRGPHNKELMSLNLTDANMADRVAKAMTHAVELCGGGNGGNKDPF